MIRFSTRSLFSALSLISVLSEPIQSLCRTARTSLFIVAPGPRSLRPGCGRFGLPHADPLRALAPLSLPAADGVTKLEEGDDPWWNRQPEGDDAIGEHGGEHIGARHPEEDERSDHSGVDGAHPTGREWDQVREHAEEEALDHDPQGHRDAEGVEARPEDGDVGPPEPDRATEGQRARARMTDECDGRTRALGKGGRGAGDRLRDSAEPPRGVSLDPALEVIGQQGDEQSEG